MSRILAIDWDRKEARAVVVEKAVTGSRSARLLAVSLEDCSDAGDIGRKLLRSTDTGSLAKAQIVVALGRDHVQLLPLTLPPAPIAELPQMVRFQAEREVASLADKAVLDYVPLSGDEHTPHRVLAAVLDRASQVAVEKLCGALHAAPQQITLRACAAASLLDRMSGVNLDSPALLVCRLADHAELVVIADGKIAMIRTVRLPSADELEEAVREADTVAESELMRPPSEGSLQGFMAMGLSPREASLASQIRRTLGAANQQLADRKVQQVYLTCGGRDTEAQLRLLSSQLGVPCRAFDPWDVASEAAVIDVSANQSATDAERFAGVLGAAIDATEGRQPAVNFLQPRRPADKNKIKRVHFLAGATAVMVLIAGAWLLYGRWAAPGREAARLRTEIDGIQKVVDQYADVQTQADLVDSWLATNVNWLDELERTSRQIRPESLSAEDFSPDQDALLTNLYFRSNSGDDAVGGRATMSGVLRSNQVVSSLVERLRSERHEVTGKEVDRDESVEGYPASFEMVMNITSEESVEQINP